VIVTRLLSFHPRFASTCSLVVLLLRSAALVLLIGVVLGPAVQAQTGTGEWTWMGGNPGTLGEIPTARGMLGVPSAQFSPGPRQWSAVWTGADGSFWILGGFGNDATGASGSFNDLWRFTPVTNQWTWVSGSASLNASGIYGTLGSPAAANSPGARYQGVTWVDKSGNLWLFGGWGYDSAGTQGYLNDLWMYNNATNQWTWKSGSNLANQFSAFGAAGQSSTSYIPGSRYSAMSWVDASGNFWLFGGQGDYLDNSSEINVAMNDLWKYSPSSGEWTWYGGEVPGSYGTLGNPAAGNLPGERTGGATWVDASGTLWLFGGFGLDAQSQVGVLGDLWSLNPANQQWTWVSGPNVANSTGDYGVLGVASSSNHSPGRMFTNVWQDKSGNVWIFGGGAVNTANQPILLNDLWEYAPTTNLWTWVAGTPLADVSQFAVNGVYGTLGIPDAANIPGGRVGAANWTDQQGNFWLYGGNWGPFINTGIAAPYLSFNDLWVYDPPASATAPQAVLTPLQLSFSTPTGVTAPAQTVTLSNFGAAALTIGNIAIGGANASAFNEYNACGTSLAPGASCTITVSFAPSASGFNAATLTVTDNAATTLPIALNGIAQAQTTLALSTSPASTSLVLAPVKLTATLSPSSDSAASTDGEIVIFRDGNQILGGEQMTNGVATMTTTQLPFGTSTLTASYAGNKYFAAATSAGSSFTVTYPTNLTATQTALVFLAGGQPVTSASRTSLVNLTATVTSNGSPVTPGIVTFCDAAYASCVGQGLIGIAQTNSKGVATFPMRFGAGAHQVVARFQVQSTLAASVSPVTAISINNALTTAGLASSGTSAGYELTATIAGFGPKNAPTGSVQFIDTSNNNAVLGTVQLEGATESQSYVVGPEIPDTAGFGWYTTTADLNGDGIPDVIVVNGVADLAGNNVPETIQVYLGKGDGTFNALAPQQIVANSPSGVASLPIFDSASITIGDFNQDGIPDLAIGLSQSPTAGAAIANTIAILLGKGDGTFAVQQTQLQPVDGSAFLAAPVVADFNGDGIPDILATYGIVDFDYSVLYLGNGDGTFQTATATTPISFFETSVPFPTYFPAVSDFNGDGIPDVGFVSQLGAYSEIGLGNGTFSSVLTADTLSPPIDQEPAYVPVVGDFNGDGKPDMAVTSPGSQIPIFLGNGDGTFTTTTQTPAVTNESWNLVTADFAGNGFDGFASANDDTTISVFKSNGDGTFTQQNITVGIGHTGPPGEIPFYPTGIAAGDFHNSGRKDIVFSIEGDYAIQTVENRLTEAATVKLENVRLAGSGTHNIVAVYTGDSLFATSTSSSVALGAESLNSTTTSFTVTPTQGLTGAPVNLSATVAPASGSTTPTGDISFLDGSTVLAVLPVNSNGSASFSSTSFVAGMHSFTAVYSGDANNLTSTSPVVPATYTTNLPAVTLSQTAALTFVSSAGTTSAPQTFTVTNSGAVNLSITGITITGSTNPSVFAQTNNCPSTLAPSALCTVSVTYTPAGEENDAAYVSIADNAVTSPQTLEVIGIGEAASGPGISISPAGPLRFSALAGATSATQIITIASTGNINLSINSVSIIGANPADFAETNNCSNSIAATGLCQIFVTFTPAAAQSYSASVSIADNVVGSPQSVSLSGTGSAAPLATQTQLSSSVNSITLGTSVNLTAQVSETAGNSIPSGTVTFYDGATSLGTALLSGNGTTPFITNALAVGTHSITATYGGDINNAGSTSAAVVVTVNAAATGSVEWTWMGGNQGTVLGFIFEGPVTPANAPVYGTQGTPSTANLPGNRYGASTWTDSNGNLWLLGGYGYDSTGTSGYLNDLWEYSPTARTWTWVGGSNVVGANDSQFGVYGTQGTAAAGNLPGGREYAASWTDNGGRLWLFGGFGSGAGPSTSDFGYLNDLWMYNPSTNLWTWEGGSNNPSTVAYTEVPGVYGTRGTPSTSNIPGARLYASFATDSRGNFWLFGGEGGDSAGNQAELNDLWMFNPSTGAWTWVNGASVVPGAATNPGSGTPGVYGTKGTASSGSMPGSRQASAAWMDLSGNLWLFGGGGEDSTGRSGELSDLWMFNAANDEWTWVGGSNTVPAGGGNPGVYGTEGSPSATDIPGSRYTASAWTDTQGNLWLFGGQGFDSAGNYGSLNDLWTYSPSANEWTWMDGSNLRSQYGSYGTLGVASPSNTPGYRNSAAAWTDKSGNFWLYGGDATSGGDSVLFYYSDLWEYGSPTATTPVLTTPTVTVTPGSSSITTAQSLTVTIGVSGNPTPTGTVTLTSGSFTSAATTLTSGSATITVPAGSLATGTDTLTVSYAPDSSSSSTYNSATGTNSVTVTSPAKTTPTVTVSPSPTNITTTQTLTVTIGVSGGSGNPTPTGSVTLSSGTYSSTATTLVSGSAMITVPAGSLATNTDTLTATYTPDSNSSSTYNSATGSNTVTVTSPAKTTPTVTVSPSPTNITTTQTLTVTIGVSGGSGNPTPTGSVTLSSGTYTSTATTLVSGGTMITIPAGSLATGTDTLTVNYTPDSASSSTYNGATGTNSVTVTAATVQVTVGTSPAGLALTVDGTSYASTQTLSWTVGSSHTIATTSPQTNGGTQNTFASWSDGGAISHSVTAPSAATSYTATFNTSYQLTTAANPSVDGTVTPTSGTYYAAGTVVNLTATPNSGYNFTNWTGSVAGAASASTTITMNAAQSVTANFSPVVVNAPVASLTPPSLSFASTTGVASAAQAATLSNTGNATLTITGITIAGTNPTDFAVTTGANACDATVAAGSSCSIYVTLTPASATSFAATLTVADNASGSPQTTTLAGTGTAPPTFAVSSTTTPQTVQPGGIATYSITATAQNGAFPNSVTLAASGLPAGATATFSPTSITPGNSSATSTLTIQTAKPVAALTTKKSPWPLAAPALALIGFFFLPGKRRRRWITLTILLLASLGTFTALTACGGGFGMTSTTPATNYTVTITGTSGTVQQTTTVQLTVE